MFKFANYRRSSKHIIMARRKARKRKKRRKGGGETPPDVRRSLKTGKGGQAKDSKNLPKPHSAQGEAPPSMTSAAGLRGYYTPTLAMSEVGAQTRQRKIANPHHRRVHHVGLPRRLASTSTPPTWTQRELSASSSGAHSRSASIFQPGFGHAAAQQVPGQHPCKSFQ